MKIFSSILLLLLFIASGNVRAEGHLEQNGNIRLKLFSNDGFACQAINAQDGILDVQDASESNGFNFCYIHPEPVADPLLNSIRLQAEGHAVKIPIRINSFLIDLPPPKLSR